MFEPLHTVFELHPALIEALRFFIDLNTALLDLRLRRAVEQVGATLAEHDRVEEHPSVLLGDRGPRALTGQDEPLLLQALDGLAHGDPADAEDLAQGGLGRQLRPYWEFSGDDLVGEGFDHREGEPGRPTWL